MSKSKMKQCKSCSKEIAANAKSCPGCGAKNKKPIYKRPWVWVIAFFIMIGAIGGSGSSSSSSTSSKSNSTSVSSETASSNTNSTNTGTTQAQQTETTTTKDEVPTEYKSALKKAKVYSDTMHMSKDGIYDQLTSEYGEKFPADAAQYAIDNVEADWNANALEKAKTYQDSMAMSSSAIYDQLISEYGEKFTAEQAQYAVDNLK